MIVGLPVFIAGGARKGQQAARGVAMPYVGILGEHVAKCGALLPHAVTQGAEVFGTAFGRRKQLVLRGSWHGLSSFVGGFTGKLRSSNARSALLGSHAALATLPATSDVVHAVTEAA